MNWVYGIFNFVSRVVDDDRTRLGKKIYCGHFKWLSLYVLVVTSMCLVCALIQNERHYFVFVYCGIGRSCNCYWACLQLLYWVFHLYTVSNGYVGVQFQTKPLYISFYLLGPLF